MKFYFTIVCSFFLFLNAKCQLIEKVEAKNAFEIISSRNTTATVIIDGRSDEMFMEKHIEGAINIDAFKDSLSTDLSKHLENKEIIVYCTNHNRAEIIIEKLSELNYKGKIVFITDGINGWNDAGFATVGI